jgi:hypothetical protein
MNGSEVALIESLQRWEASVRQRRGRLWWRELEKREDETPAHGRGALRRERLPRRRAKSAAR